NADLSSSLLSARTGQAIDRAIKPSRHSLFMMGFPLVRADAGLRFTWTPRFCCRFVRGRAWPGGMCHSNATRDDTATDPESLCSGMTENEPHQNANPEAGRLWRRKVSARAQVSASETAIITAFISRRRSFLQSRSSLVPGAADRHPGAPLPWRCDAVRSPPSFREE